MSAKAVEKILDGPGGYAIAIAAAVLAVVVLVEFIKNEFTPGANLQGPAPGQSWFNYLIGSGGTLDSQGNYVAPDGS